MEPHLKWDHKADFFFSCVGLSVGVGHMWRFPYLALDNGGGAFLFVYLIVLLILGKPLYYLEIFLGQFGSSGSMGIWGTFPFGRGLGVAMAVGSLCLALYYNMYLAYALIYIYHSLAARLPWTGCYSSWGADTRVCYIRKPGIKTCKAAANRLYQRYKDQNITFGVAINTTERTLYVPHRAYTIEMSGCVNATKSAAEHFYWDAWCFVILNFIWGIFVSTAYFSTLGSTAFALNSTISELVGEEMESLAFVSYTEAMSNLPFPQMWCTLFFVSILLVGINSSVCLIRTVLMAIVEQFPDLKNFSVELTLLFCIGAFLLGLPLCTSAGPYFMKFLGSYFGAPFFVIAALAEVLFLSWGYTSRRILFDMEFMYTTPTSIIYKAMWGFVIPVMLALTSLSRLIRGPTLTMLGYTYPLYVHIMGSIFIIFAFCQVPMWALDWFRKRGFNCDIALQPSYKWGPEEPALFNAYQARLRNRGLVAMMSPFPVRFMVTRGVSPDAALPVLFAAESVRPPPTSAYGRGGLEAGPPERVWALPANLQSLGIPSVVIPLPRTADGGPEYPPEFLPPAPARRRSSVQTVPAILHRFPIYQPPKPTRVSRFLPTLSPNSLGPQFSESPMRFGLVGRLFVRKHDEKEGVLVPAIPTQAPRFNPIEPSLQYPVQPGGPVMVPAPPMAATSSTLAAAPEARSRKQSKDYFVAPTVISDEDPEGQPRKSILRR